MQDKRIRQRDTATVTIDTNARGRVPALLLIGAMGTGKSDTSYRVFSRLYQQGTPTARLDLDDIGMAHPAPVEDPDNFVVKAAAMSACWDVFKGHSARCLVVSGALDTSAVVEHVTGQIADAEWTIVRLRIGTAERRQRVLRRGLLLGYAEADVEPALRAGDADEARLANEHLPGTVLDTDGLSSDEVVDLVLRETGWPSTPSVLGTQRRPTPPRYSRSR